MLNRIIIYKKTRYTSTTSNNITLWYIFLLSKWFSNLLNVRHIICWYVKSIVFTNNLLTGLPFSLKTIESYEQIKLEWDHLIILWMQPHTQYWKYLFICIGKIDLDEELYAFIWFKVYLPGTKLMHNVFYCYYQFPIYKCVAVSLIRHLVQWENP